MLHNFNFRMNSKKLVSAVSTKICNCQIWVIDRHLFLLETYTGLYLFLLFCIISARLENRTSKTEESAIVVISPRSRSSLAIFFRTRLIILPALVLGSPGAD